ncbi:MAG: putative Fe-S protein YdhL (DUF1289 family) [Limimaricola cinnabarinus]|jgi:predicted Fe-S protein YdhL (DUF1289 family)|uniref:DUF1289 domain-containing protein n=1 Tax=Limimaricola cinnabarinus TaxID=1125964 RepID=UPI0039E4EFB6
MSDEVWQRAEIESPCVKLCAIHPETRLCLGCARSMEEIAAWGRMVPEERARIMAELPTREAAPKGRRGGRKARLER